MRRTHDMDFPEALSYTKEHEWVEVLEEGKVARVGITDFAQDALGDVVYVDIPEIGTEVRAGQPFGEVESTKSVSDVYAPVTGTVVQRNDKLGDEPALVNDAPYGDGWMVAIQMADPSELGQLLTAEAYRTFTEADAAE
jgi:glycine cleavage system H protein